MANRNKKIYKYSVKEILKKREIEKKYYNILQQTFEDYKDRTMGELNIELDRIKEEMRKEFEECNLIR